MKNMSPSQYEQLANLHIRRFDNMIKYGNRHVNVPECHRYLGIWKSIKEKQGVDLTPDERAEVLDAYTSGEFPEIFRGILIEESE